MTISSGGTVLAADLNSAFHGELSNLDSAAAGRRFGIPRRAHAYSPATRSNEENSIIFTPATDEEVVALIAWARAASGNGEVQAKLSVFGSDLGGANVTVFLLDEEPSVNASYSSAAAATDYSASILYDSVTDEKVFLSRGVTYKLQLTVVSGTPAQAAALLRTRAAPRRA